MHTFISVCFYYLFIFVVENAVLLVSYGLEASARAFCPDGIFFFCYTWPFLWSITVNESIWRYDHESRASQSSPDSTARRAVFLGYPGNSARGLRRWWHSSFPARCLQFDNSWHVWHISLHLLQSKTLPPAIEVSMMSTLLPEAVRSRSHRATGETDSTDQNNTEANSTTTTTIMWLYSIISIIIILIETIL